MAVRYAPDGGVGLPALAACRAVAKLLLQTTQRQASTRRAMSVRLGSTLSAARNASTALVSARLPRATAAAHQRRAHSQDGHRRCDQTRRRRCAVLCAPTPACANGPRERTWGARGDRFAFAIGTAQIAGLRIPPRQVGATRQQVGRQRPWRRRLHEIRKRGAPGATGVATFAGPHAETTTARTAVNPSDTAHEGHSTARSFHRAQQGAAEHRPRSSRVRPARRVRRCVHGGHKPSPPWSRSLSGIERDRDAALIQFDALRHQLEKASIPSPSRARCRRSALVSASRRRSSGKARRTLL